MIVITEKKMWYVWTITEEVQVVWVNERGKTGTEESPQ